MKNRIIIISSFILLSINTFAQEDSDCSKTLKKAQIIYDAGEIEKVEGMIQACIEDGFTKTEKTEAYKLLILVNLFEDNQPAAESKMIDLLKTNPDFKPKFNDHKEIKDLYAKFRTDPLFIIDFLGGVNFAYGYLLSDYSIDHSVSDLNNEKSYSKYKAGLGVNGGFNVNYYIKNLWRVHSGFSYRTQSFTTDDTYGSIGTSDSTQQITEAIVSTTVLEIPLGITKEFGRKVLTPHVGVGGAINYLIGSNHLLERQYLIEGAAPAQGPSIATLPETRNLNFAVYGKAGIRYKIGLTGKIIVEAKFNMNLLNQTNSNNRYQNSELIYKYYFLPDDYLLHNLSFSVGYSQLIYKPKKIK